MLFLGANLGHIHKYFFERYLMAFGLAIRAMVIRLGEVKVATPAFVTDFFINLDGFGALVSNETAYWGEDKTYQ